MVEIRELVIKTRIYDEKAAGNENRTARNDQDLIKSCVEEVLRVLKREKER